ncbi:hypothetical protein GC170_07715 [bacterium]|nr:hypothetical protein [bacterium]
MIPPFSRIAFATLMAAVFSPCATQGDEALTLPKLPALKVAAPVTFPSGGLKPGLYEAKPPGSDRSLLIQVGIGPEAPDKAVAIVPAGMELKGGTVPVKSVAASGNGVMNSDDGAGISFSVHGKPFFTALAQSGSKPIIYPVYGPGGQKMTRAYPIETVEGEDRDHPHQRSMWMTFGNVNGIDFWAADPINGEKPHFGTKTVVNASAEGGPLAGTLLSEVEWRDNSGKLVLSEENTIVVYAVADQRVMDVTITLKAPADKAAVFGDTKEGMFGLRVPSVLDTKAKKGGKIINAEGIEDDVAWGKSSPWVDYSGIIDGKTVGVAILNHPDSFRYPTHWHVRNYGLFAANPFGYKDFGLGKTGEHTLEPGKKIRFGYRVIFHDGRAADAGIADSFRAYSAGAR